MIDKKFLDNHIIPSGINAGKTYSEVFYRTLKQSKVTNSSTSCWIWSGAIFPNGYGGFNIRHRRMLAHRISLILQGKNLNNLVVCHSCDVRACVNPSHLFLGTQKDNMQDCLNKGRFTPAFGDSSGKTKFSSKDVENIFSLRKKNMLCKEIASIYGVSTACISRILQGKRWVRFIREKG